MDVTGPSVVRAVVRHARHRPAANRFSYAIDCLLLDEATLGGERRLKLFSSGRPNLVSLQPGDHGVSGCNGIEGVRRLAQEAGIGDIEQVLLLAHPRYWGYTFNPVSFWFCVGGAGNLRAVVAEVHNTFGDRHAYFCAGEHGADIGRDCWIVSPKRFHVSPFFKITGKYRFQFQFDETSIIVRIIYEDGDGGGLYTTIAGKRLPFTDRELARALVRRPLGAVRTTALIHWQALRLWRKGISYQKRPKPPGKSVT